MNYDNLKKHISLHNIRKFNFNSYKSGTVYSYYDKENVVSIRIFKSGWKGKYNCILEWGEYETTDSHIYTAEQIYQHYGITIFLRKEKLIKINESLL